MISAEIDLSPNYPQIKRGLLNLLKTKSGEHRSIARVYTKKLFEKNGYHHWYMR